jgi:hypothetical protein
MARRPIIIARRQAFKTARRPIIKAGRQPFRQPGGLENSQGAFNNSLETGLLEKEMAMMSGRWLEKAYNYSQETGLKDSQEAFSHCLETGLLDSHEARKIAEGSSIMTARKPLIIAFRLAF